MLNILIRYLRLAVHVWVIRRRKLNFSTKDSVILLSEGKNELKATVRDNRIKYIKVTSLINKEKSSYTFRRNRIVIRDRNRFLKQTVYNYYSEVIAFLIYRELNKIYR